MLISAIRTLIIYLLVILSIRIMGKRQISELRPSELVVALLISDLAIVPMQDTGTPLLYGVLPIFLLVALELLLSGIMLKFPAVERLISGNPVTVIRHGKLDVQALKKLRMLKHGRAHFAIAEIARNGKSRLLNILPFVALGGQHVLRASDRLVYFCHCYFPFG